MDHLPLPRDPRYGRPKVPLYSKQAIDFSSPDTEAWVGYEERTGWEWDGRISAFKALPANDEKLSGLMAFLQEWLFFGLLGCVLGSLYNRKHFVNAQRHVSTAGLIRQLQCWSRSLEGGYPWLNTEASRDQLLADIRLNLEDTWTWLYGLERFEAAKTSGPFSDLLLCVECLCKTLEHAVVSLQAIRRRTKEGEDASLLPWSIPSRPWPPNAIVVTRMTHDGWCPYTVNRLGDLLGGTALWYLSCLRRRGRAVDHSECDKKQCQARKLLKETYQPRHVTDDCRCALLGPSVKGMCDILDDGGLPLLQIAGSEVDSATMTLSSSKEHKKYVALSHVISDGWGNFKSNAMPTCQLIRIQRLVDGLFLDHDRDHMPIWIDTITVPLADLSRKHHLLAMERMIPTYSNAAKVLVLDEELLNTSIDLPIEDLQLRVAACDWMSRLWTLQEGVLTRQTALFFQMADGVLQYDSKFTAGLLKGDPFDDLDTKVLCWTSLLQIQNIVGLTDSKAPFPQRFDVLMSLLRGRSTSIPGDVPYVFCNLTRTDPTGILRLPYEHDIRQQHLAQTRQEWPESIVFSAVPRLHEYGLRWFPKSFVASDNAGGGMGSLRQEPSYAGTNNGRMGTVRSRGLEVYYQGFIFEPVTVSKAASFDIHIPEGGIYLSAGAVYRDIACNTNRYSDIAPAPGRRMGFVQRDPTLRPGANNPAFLVTIMDEDDDIVYCRYEWRLGLVLHSGDSNLRVREAFAACTDIASDPKTLVARRSQKRWCIG